MLKWERLKVEKLKLKKYIIIIINYTSIDNLYTRSWDASRI
jgi:hypothetical protein